MVREGVWGSNFYFAGVKSRIISCFCTWLQMQQCNTKHSLINGDSRHKCNVKPYLYTTYNIL